MIQAVEPKQDMEKEHEKVLKFVDEYLDATTESRELSQKCRDYFDGYQWTDEDKAALKKRKQPCITNNRIKPKIQFLLGMEMQTRTDPKAYPRKPDAEDIAEVSTEALRFIEDNNHSKQDFSEGFKNYLIEGTQGHEVIIEEVNGTLEVRHNTLHWDRLFYDPHSRQKDFKDARFLGTLQWYDIAEGKEDFKKPDDDEEVWTIESNNTDETHEDRPLFFTDSKRKRVRIFFCYYIKNGVWHYCIFTKGGFIKYPAPSPYLDDIGEPEPQFVFQSAFVDLDGNRYGEVASYLDGQDDINQRGSKLLHLLSVRQTWGNKGAVNNPATIKNELAKPDGHAEFGVGEWGKDFGVIPTNDMAAGQALLLQEAKKEIDSIGANAALTGTEERKLSGRALDKLQQGGSVELGPVFDGNKFCKNRVHRMMWNRVRQFWTEERWVRVADTEGNPKFSRINGKIRLGDLLKQKVDEQGVNSLTPQEQDFLASGDPRIHQVVDVENPVKDMDVDIVIDESFDTVTLQQEQFEILARLYEANPNAVPFELLIKASQLRNKDELLKLIEGGTEEQQEALREAQRREQEEQSQLIKAAAVAEIEKDRADAQKTHAETGKTVAETKQIYVETGIEMQEAAAV